MRLEVYRLASLSVVACGLILPILGACSDIRETKIDRAAIPADFAVDITILTGSGAKDLPSAHARQGKFTMLADGSLHADYGDSLDFDTRTAPTRWLYEQQVEGVWRLCDREGWLDPATSNPDVWPGAVRPARDEIVYLLWFHADSTDWWFVRRAKITEAPDPHAVAIVRGLAELAWATDRSPDRNLPHRYDFGPNPYAGFTKAPPYSPPKPQATAP